MGATTLIGFDPALNVNAQDDSGIRSSAAIFRSKFFVESPYVRVGLTSVEIENA